MSKAPARRKLSDATVVQVVTKSKRRCCLCFALDNDSSEKQGQIAHLDEDRSNDDLDNLAWLCMDHHSNYDSKTSQHKNYTEAEVKYYREQLHQQMEKPATQQTAPDWQEELKRKMMEQAVENTQEHAKAMRLQTKLHAAEMEKINAANRRKMLGF